LQAKKKVNKLTFPDKWRIPSHKGKIKIGVEIQQKWY